MPLTQSGQHKITFLHMITILHFTACLPHLNCVQCLYSTDSCSECDIDGTTARYPREGDNWCVIEAECTAGAFYWDSDNKECKGI